METTPLTAASIRLSRITITVIEGDVTILEILGSWLWEAEGFSCVGQFQNSGKALVEVIDRKPDVVLVDINIPNLGGVECIRKLKSSMPETQFVAWTTFEDSNRIFDAPLAGATGYLLKKTPRATPVSTLRDLHAGGPTMTSNIARKVMQLLQTPRCAQHSDDALSKQDHEVLALLAQGYLCEEIADQLRISPPTVSRNIRRGYETLHILALAGLRPWILRSAQDDNRF